MNDMETNRPSVRTIHRPPRRGGWRSPRVVLAAALVAVLGAVIGSGLTVVYFRHYYHFRPRSRPSEQEIIDRINAKIARDFSPGEAQAARIREVVAAHMREVIRMRQGSRESIGDEFDVMREEIGEILGPEKAEQWNREVERRVGRRKGGRRQAEEGAPPAAGESWMR